MADVSKTAKLIRPLNGAQIRNYAFGEAIDVGEVVFIASDGDLELADEAALLSAMAIGIVISAPDGATAGVAGDRGDVVYGGPVTGFSGMTPGTWVYASATAGAVADAAGGNYIWIIGYAMDATTVFVAPFTYDIADQSP